MRRKLNDEALREVIRARLTKGSAFMLTGEAYHARQEKVKAELATMSRADIIARWPELCYDIK